MGKRTVDEEEEDRGWGRRGQKRDWEDTRDRSGKIG